MNQPPNTNTGPMLNLLDTPWIPVRSPDGRIESLGLLDLFERAHRIESLAETSPPNLVALYRLLLAIVHRALTRHQGRWTDRDRARWLRHGLPADALAAYLAHWRDRFWLFHPNHPFMQVAALADAEETRDKRKPWTQVSLAKACGNAPVVFDHAVDGAPVPREAVAVLRDLLGFLQFTPGGLVKVFRSADKAGPLANTAATLPLGATLAATLIQCLHPATTAPDHDLPCWERPQPNADQLRAAPQPATGPCDRYARLARSVLLIAESPSGLPAQVRWLRFGAGLGLGEDDNAPDPMASFRKGSNGLLRLAFTHGRAFWRDLGALLPQSADAESSPAATLSWAANLYEAAGQWDHEQPVLVAGLSSDQAKLVRWRVEHVSLPATSLHSADAAAALRLELARCEELFRLLRSLAVEQWCLAMPDSHHKDTRAKARVMLDASPFAAAYFGTAETQLPQTLAHITAGNLDAAHRAWSGALLRSAQQAWAAARSSLGNAPLALRADAMTHGRFLALLAPLRAEPAPIQEESTA